VRARVQVLLAVLMTTGYGMGFASYPFRVGWANLLLGLQMALMAAALARPPCGSATWWAATTARSSAC